LTSEIWFGGYASNGAQTLTRSMPPIRVGQTGSWHLVEFAVRGSQLVTVWGWMFPARFVNAARAGALPG
jgi:hypothetical protein